MSILDLTEHPAWYAVRVAEQRFGPNGGSLGIRYQWSAPKFLNNFDAMKFVVDMNLTSPSRKNGTTVHQSADLFQWDGARWKLIP